MSYLDPDYLVGYRNAVRHMRESLTAIPMPEKTLAVNNYAVWGVYKCLGELKIQLDMLDANLTTLQEERR